QHSDRAGDLADVVGARVDGDLTGRAAVGGIGLVGRAVDLEVEATRVVGRRERLDDLDLARLTDVGDRADDVVTEGDAHVERTRMLGAVVRRDDRARAVLVLAPYTTLFLSQHSDRAGDLADVVGARVDGDLTGRAAVGGIGLVGRAVDLE